MKLEIIAHTPNPEKIIAGAAKLCYSPVGVECIFENLSDQKASEFIDKLSKLGHESPLEHVSFTFAIEGISRACSHQLVRHRIASFSQQSQRYVKLEQFEYIIPKEIEAIEDAKKIFIIAMEQDQYTYDALVDILYTNHYDKLILKGKNEKVAAREAEKMAIEDARYVFPNACETKMVFTMNTRTLLNFFTHRCCDRAQSEIRDVAFAMLKEVKKVAPTLFKNAGPSCYRQGCKEGIMSCKK